MTGFLTEVADYYAARLAEHGPTARGVDWNGADGQVVRFRELTRVIDRDAGFSVNDLGCGYGALADYLAQHFGAVDYRGYDVAEPMIAAAGATPREGASFVHAAEPDRTADFGLASGIFNVRLGADRAAWQCYIEQTLDRLDATSRRGFAFNCLTLYSEGDRMRPDLHYADPLTLFDRCKRNYARNVALLHDYGLYEFTVLVRKDR